MNTNLDKRIDEILRATIYMGTSANINSMNRCRRKAHAAIKALITEAKIEELERLHRHDEKDYDTELDEIIDERTQTLKDPEYKEEN